MNEFEKFSKELANFIKNTPMEVAFPAFMSIVCFQAVENATSKKEILSAAIRTIDFFLKILRNKKIKANRWLFQ